MVDLADFLAIGAIDLRPLNVFARNALMVWMGSRACHGISPFENGDRQCNSIVQWMFLKRATMAVSLGQLVPMAPSPASFPYRFKPMLRTYPAERCSEILPHPQSTRYPASKRGRASPSSFST